MYKDRKLKRGDIIWLKKDVNINMGSNIQKLNRPFVVVSNEKNNSNDKSPIINIVTLSKQISKSNYPMHTRINKDKYGLDYDSIIMAEQIFTVNKDKVGRVIATLDSKDLMLLNKALFIQLINEMIPNQKKEEFSSLFDLNNNMKFNLNDNISLNFYN